VFIPLESGDEGLMGFPIELPEEVALANRDELPLGEFESEEATIVEPPPVAAPRQPVRRPWPSSSTRGPSIAAVVVLVFGGLTGGLAGWWSASRLGGVHRAAPRAELAPPPSVVSLRPVALPKTTLLPMAPAPVAQLDAPWRVDEADREMVGTAGDGLRAVPPPSIAVAAVQQQQRIPARTDAPAGPLRMPPSPVIEAPVTASSEKPASAPSIPDPIMVARETPPQPAVPLPAPVAAVALPARADRAEIPRPAVERVDDDAAVHVVLDRYREAYEHLDAAAAKRVWRGVDERALSKAFADLESQSITFDECKTVFASPTALAFCRGKATYVGRVGSRSQTQARQWTFSLRKEGSGWQVENVRVR
jgi:hypothetical protein